MQQGKMVSAYSDAVKSAAENKTGSMNGFMGIGMMNMNTGNPKAKICKKCNAKLAKDSKFCPNCGEKVE